MKCQNCHQPLDDGAAFCGNCGAPIPMAQPMVQTVAQPAPQNPYGPQYSGSGAQFSSPQTGIVGGSFPAPTVNNAMGYSALTPLYATPTMHVHKDEMKALMSLLFGIVGLMGALFLSFVGLGFGIAGIAMGTMSRSSTKRKMSTIGLVLSVLATLAGLGVWAYPIIHKNEVATKPTTSSSSQESYVGTACYSFNFEDQFNVDQKSCTIDAYNGINIGQSSEVYRVYAQKSQQLTFNEFDNASKSSLEQGLDSGGASFKVTSAGSATFAASLAYKVVAYDSADDISIVQEAVYHPTKQGDNIFIIVHAVSGSSVDLNNVESEWQWN